jgi:predicted  nucleic acid-binding Zn-ribbon protein
MPDADKTTIKIRALSDKTERIVPQNTLTEGQSKALELVKKSAQLEDEKKKSLEYLKTIEQLQESLRQEKTRTAEMAAKIAGLEAQLRESVSLEAKAKEFAELEAKIKELTEVLGRISGIAASRKAD